MSDPRDVRRRLVLTERLERLWADDRFLSPSDRRGEGVQVRVLAEALIWSAWHRIPARDRGEWVAGRVGQTSWGDVVHRIVRHDIPRYEPPDPRWATVCPVPMQRGPRAGQPCGKNPAVSMRLTDPTTGQWRNVGWCRNHADHVHEARAAERATRAGHVPEPLPNRGGLLPCHTNVTNWPDQYAAASYGDWKPPRVGIRADDWPVLAKVDAHERPKLVLLHGAAHDHGDDPPAPPAALTLVTATDDLEDT